MPRQTRGGRAPSKRRGGPRTGPDAPRPGRAAGPEPQLRRRGGRGRGRRAADGGTGRRARRSGTREPTLDRGGPGPRGIEADPAEGGRRGAGGPGPTPERTCQGGAAERGGGHGAGRADAAWHRGRGAGGPAATPRTPGDRGGGGGAAKLTRGPRSGDHRSARGRRTPPTDSWGVRRPRGGQDARPIRPRMGPGREQAPRRPHDAGRPIRAVAGTMGFRRPDRGGRP